MISQNIIIIILAISILYLYYRLPSIEKMSNVDKATEEKIREIYKIDTDAIRNLSNLARNLTVDGKLVVPGGLEIKGDLKVEGSTETVNQTKTKNLVIDKGSDIHGGGMSVYGGKDEPFYINYFTNDNRNERKGYVMLGNGNSSNVLFSGVSTVTGDLSVGGNINLANNLKMQDAKTIESTGRLHIHPQERLYLLAKADTFITGDWGGNGNVHTSGSVNTNVINMGSNRIRNLGTRIGFRMSHPNGCCNNPRLEPREFSIDYDWQQMSSLRYWAWRDNGSNERGRVAQDGHTWDVSN